MNYPGFILYGFFALILLISSIALAFRFKNRATGWLQGLGLIFVGMILLMMFGRTLFHGFQRDEDLTGAAKRGDAVAVSRLLGQGANPNVRWYDGSTPLNVAQKNGHPDVVQLLQNAGAKR